MLEGLREMWAKWKVQVSVVGGVLVVATVYGTCSYEPPSSVTEDQVEAEPVSNMTETQNTETENTETENTETENTETENTETENTEVNNNSEESVSTETE